MNASDNIALASLLISLLAILYSYFTNTKKYELISEYKNNILNWFNSTTEILLRLKSEAEIKFPDQNLKRELLSKLSSKIEVGRFYFPNITKGNNYGKEKPLAFQGYRNLVLDFLVFSYRLFEKDDAFKFLDHASTLQRHFTSQMFEIIDPVKFLADTKKHTDKTFIKELSFEDFIDKEPELIKKYIKDYEA